MSESAKPKKQILTPQEKIELAFRIADEGKAEDIVTLDVHDVSNVTDFFIIMTGNSQVHLRALGNRIQEAFREKGLRPTAKDAERGSGWVVYDYGNVIIHIMTQEFRSMYDLERLWADAPRTEIESENL